MVGTGNKINLLDHNWIPGHPAGFFHTLVPIPEGVVVDSFLTVYRKAWEERVVRSVFPQMMVNAVSQISLSVCGG